MKEDTIVVLHKQKDEGWDDRNVSLCDNDDGNATGEEKARLQVKEFGIPKAHIVRISDPIF